MTCKRILVVNFTSENTEQENDRDINFNCFNTAETIVYQWVVTFAPLCILQIFLNSVSDFQNPREIFVEVFVKTMLSQVGVQFTRVLGL